jgi:AcrR family transcriptional regulator
MLRERQKEERRQQILIAAEALIRERGTVDFPMLDLSERAGLSPATPYNLFGSKLAILWALLKKYVDRAEIELAAGVSSDPYLQVVTSAGHNVRFFARDPDLYRPLCGYLLRVNDAVHLPAFMARLLNFWIKLTTDFLKSSLLPAGITQELYCRQLLDLYVGAFDRWAQGELSDAALPMQVQFSTGMTLMAIAPEPDRSRLAKLLGGLGRELESAEAQLVSGQRA